MSNFELALREELQDDTVFYAVVEAAKKAGKTIPQLVISLLTADRVREDTVSEHERQTMAEQVWVSFWKQRAINPKGFDAAVSASLRGLNIPDMSGEELREWALD